MSDEGNKEKAEEAKNLKQVPVRLHRNDYNALRKLFIDGGWNFQKFVSACIEEYLNRNPLLIKVLDDWKIENDRPKRLKKSYSHSNREKAELLDEIDDDERDE